MPDQRGNATVYGPVRAWHAACDSALANGFEPFAARQQKDIAMHTSIGAVAERPFTRRLLAATVERDVGVTVDGGDDRGLLAGGASVAGHCQLHHYYVRV